MKNSLAQQNTDPSELPLLYFMENYEYHIFSPYRMCPIGAHVDHQHGLVTGFAIDKGVDLWFNVREDAMVNLTSLSFEGEVHLDLSKRSEEREKHWGDYVRGAKYALKKRFELTRGIDGVLKGSLPVGGLSSSAAVLIAYVMAFAKTKNIKTDYICTSKESERPAPDTLDEILPSTAPLYTVQIFSGH